MICHLRGKIIETSLEKDLLRVVIDVQGVGYEVWMARASGARLGDGQAATLLISESVTAFDGATTLYGFATADEKDLYSQLRENVDGMGPKKAMETLDKISKSLPDFKRAILDEDTRLLVSVFGFTKKTAEKLVFALKGKAPAWNAAGAPKWAAAPATPVENEALSALLNLGYAEDEARELLRRAMTEAGAEAGTEALIKESLRLLGLQISG